MSLMEYRTASSARLHCLLAIDGIVACTLPLMLPHTYYFAYKTSYAFRWGAHQPHQLQPTEFYNPTLALALIRSQ
jgi:hypothetical protein